jgi:Fe-S-cluster containining protein
MKEIAGKYVYQNNIVEKSESCMSPSLENTGLETGSVSRNKEVAYSGRLGMLREQFCIDFISRKQGTFEKIYQEQKRKTIYEDITCNKGCANCCVLSVGASIQEGEAIVYYLYHNAGTLENFLKAYPGWRAKIKLHENLFNKTPPGNAKTNSGIACGFQYKIIDDIAEYTYSRLNIVCPFLCDGVCSIYEVRPLVCAGLIATTPPERCNPLCKERARQYQISNDFFLADNDTYKFYAKDLEKPLWSIMPIMVYNILEYGLEWVLAVTGINENLLNDENPEQIIR